MDGKTEKGDESEDLEETIKFHRNIILNLQRTKGPNHDKTVEAEHELAKILADDEEKYDLALQLYSKVLKHTSSRYGEQDEKTADLKLKIAIMQKSLHKYEEALEFFNDVLKIRENYYGENSLNVTTVRSHIASVYREQERYDEALEIYNTIYDNMVSEFGTQDHRALMAKFWIARVLMKRGDDKEALQHFAYLLPKFRGDDCEEEAKVVSFFIKRIRQRNNCHCAVL